MTNWASLIPELVQSIANCVLLTSTGGVGSYIDMRVVCPSWRSSIAKPSPLAAVADLRFRPRHWIMVDQKYDDRDDDDDSPRLFFHVLSGRFRRLRLPMLRDQIIFGASDGLLVLGEDAPGRDSSTSSVLNPLTGDMLHFTTTLDDYYGGTVFTLVSGVSYSMLVLWWASTDSIECARPTSCDVFSEKDMDTNLMSVIDACSVFKIVGPPEQFRHELVAQLLHDVDAWDNSLVESDGELLLVRHGRTALKVFKVDIEGRLLEEIKSLGRSRALFIGDHRCLSVDADKLIPPVDGDCIYLPSMLETRSACMYNLRDGTIGIISSSRDYYLDRPFSLVHVLLKYCNAWFM